MGSPSPPRLLVLVLAVLTVAAAGCGADEEGSATAPGETETETEIETRTEVETETAAAEPEPGREGPEPVGEFRIAETASDGFPSAGREVSYLVDVRAASHDAGAAFPAFDRVVLELEGPEPPTWRVTYVEPPVRQDASGRPVEVRGRAFLELRLTPASGVDLSGAEPREIYGGPDRIRVDGHAVLEVVQTGDFEANLAWVVGVRRQTGFAAVFFEDPLRLVVDVAAP